MNKIIIVLLIVILVLSGCESSYSRCYRDCISLEVKQFDDCSYTGFSWTCEEDEHFYQVKEECNKRCG